MLNKRNKYNHIVEWKLVFIIFSIVYTIGFLVFYAFYSITHFSMRRSEILIKFWYLFVPIFIFAFIYKFGNKLNIRR